MKEKCLLAIFNFNLNLFTVYFKDLRMIETILRNFSKKIQLYITKHIFIALLYQISYY